MYNSLNIYVPALDITVKYWNIGNEKQYLLNKIETSNDDEKINNLFKYILPEAIKLSLEDKLYLLLYIRTVTIGEDVTNITYTCSHCHRPSEGFYNINESLNFAKDSTEEVTIDENTYVLKHSNNILDSIISINNNSNKDFITNFIDELSIKQLNIIIDKIKNIELGYYDFSPKVKCMLCSKTTTYASDVDTVINLIINNDLLGLYKLEINLKISANFSLEEIHNMLPFEKDIYINTINNVRGNNGK